MELASNIMMKYYYTTIVGVDYMLSQILSARKYEVYMEMASKNAKWKDSRPAKRAAELRANYVTLMDNFCLMAGRSTADLPAFSNYRLHKLNKRRKEDRKAKLAKEKSEKVGDLEAMFKSIDEDGDGNLDTNELNHALKSGKYSEKVCHTLREILHDMKKAGETEMNWKTSGLTRKHRTKNEQKSFWQQMWSTPPDRR
tara:strand:- start:21 stop:614 length:594 start_codon:yes stop_codon:yes gene_type:complete